MNPREIVTTVRVIDANTGKTYDKIKKTTKDFGRSIEEVSVTMDKNNKIVANQTKTITGLNERFQMHYLSVMFFGMQIQRMFLTMARTGSDMLVKITEGATAQSAAIIGLGAEWDFLQFTIGEAIGAWIQANPWLMEMIEGFSDWIQQNQQLVGWLMVLGAFLGSLLFVIGTVSLGTKGIVAMMAAWSTVAALSTGQTAALGIGFGFLSASIWGTILPIAAAAGAIALLYLAWENNLFGIKDVTYNVFSEVARGIIKLSGMITDFAILLLDIQTKIESAVGVKNKDALRGLRDLKEGKKVLTNLLEYSYTPEAKAGVMDYKPVTDYMGQIMNLQTNVNIQPTQPNSNNMSGIDWDAIGRLIGKGQASEIKAQLAGVNF